MLDRRSRQRELQADAADPCVHEGQGRHLDGQEHYDALGHQGAYGKNPDLEKLLRHIRGNVGLVFTKNDLIEIRDLLLANKVEAPARTGTIAPVDVVIPAQNTGLGPEKTSFFQALAIPTKISRGTIEIINSVNILKSGDKVGASDATLLNMLKIYLWFTYGLELQQVYDSGTVFDPSVLDITDDDIYRKFVNERKENVAIGDPQPRKFPTTVRNPKKSGTWGQLLPPEIFANMMAFTYFTWKVISRDCVTSAWTSQHHFLKINQSIFHNKTINQSMYRASENSQHRTGDKIWGACCEVKPSVSSDVVVVNVTSQNRNP